uniref:Putative ycf20-like protein n=2 Tax=Davidia involucrata TaxID=16924 RepID=A0A5B6YMD8_DAVIN
MQCSDVIMSTKIPATLKYPRYTTLLSSKSFKPKFLFVTFPPETALSLSLRVYPRLRICSVSHLSSISISKRMDWLIRSSADGSGLNSPSGNGTSGGTRLVRAIQTLQVKLNARIQEIRNGFPMKVLFFLVGFYSATAFATVIGQTGDWDILSAGLAVIVVEVIGALMYKASFPLFNKIRSLITMFNYWKAGLSLGLFLDAFKYEIDNILGLQHPFNFELDSFPLFL